MLACCCSGLSSSFAHLAGFLQLKRMPCSRRFSQVSPGRTSSPSASSHWYTRFLIVTALRHRTSDTRMMYSLSRVMSAGDSNFFPAKRRCSCRAPFPAVGSVRVDPIEQPGTQPLDLTACSVAVLFSTGPTCRGTNRERWGRRGFGGLLPCCRWARLQRVQRLWRLGWHKERWCKLSRA